MIKTTSDRVHCPEYEPERDPNKFEACRAFARALNTRNIEHLEPWLSEDLSYYNQFGAKKLEGKEAYLDFFRSRMELFEKEGASSWAELAYTKAFGAGDCVVMAYETPDNYIQTVLFELEAAKIKKISMCGIPSPNECEKTGERPGCNE